MNIATEAGRPFRIARVQTHTRLIANHHRIALDHNMLETSYTRVMALAREKDDFTSSMTCV